MIASVVIFHCKKIITKGLCPGPNDPGRALFVGMNFVTSPLLFRKSAIYLEQFLMAV